MHHTHTSGLGIHTKHPISSLCLIGAHMTSSIRHGEDLRASRQKSYMSVCMCMCTCVCMYVLYLDQGSKGSERLQSPLQKYLLYNVTPDIDELFATRLVNMTQTCRSVSLMKRLLVSMLGKTEGRSDSAV